MLHLKPSKAAVSQQVTAENKKRCQKEDNFRTYFQVINDILKIYTARNSIGVVDDESSSFKQPAEMDAIFHCNVQWERAFICGSVYNGPRWKTKFTKELDNSIRYYMYTYWGAHQDATLHNLAHYASCLVKLRKGTSLLILSIWKVKESQLRTSEYSKDEASITLEIAIE